MPVYLAGYAKPYWQEIYIFFLRVWQNDAVLWAANRFVGSQTPKHNAFELINKNFENLNSISNISQEADDFLVLTDSVIICIYSRRNQQTFLWRKLPTDIFVTRGTIIIPPQSYWNVI